jgi:hypothetical protein
MHGRREPEIRALDDDFVVHVQFQCLGLDDGRFDGEQNSQGQGAVAFTPLSNGHIAVVGGSPLKVVGRFDNVCVGDTSCMEAWMLTLPLTPEERRRRFRLESRMVWDEPIASAITLVFYYIVGLAPQMPDMFAGMTVGFDGGGPQVGWWRPLSFHLFAATFGLAGWYWTRAALLGPLQMRYDAFNRSELVAFLEVRDLHKQSEPIPDDLLFGYALERASFHSFFLVLLMLIVVSGIIYPSVTSYVGMLGVTAVGWLVYHRHLFGLSGGVRAPNWAWRWRITAIFAAAPGGWPVAAGVFAVSVCGAWLIAEHPDFIEGNLHTPAAALAALTILVGPLVVVLAVCRDILALAELVALLLYVRLLRLVGRTQLPVESDIVRRFQIPAWALIPGLALFLACFFGFLTPLGNPSNLHVVRNTGVALAENCVPRDKTPEDNLLRRPCLLEALNGWIGAHPDERDAPGPMPVVIVAAEGGASRAAVWLLSAMRMLDAKTEGLFGRHLFAISGVSGGSLGAVTYLEAVRAYGQGKPWFDWKNRRIVAALDRLGDGDLLAAGISTYFLNDMLGRFAGVLWSGVPDRAEALERAFERHWAWGAALAVPKKQAEAGLIKLWSDAPAGAPHLLLNGTDGETGGRLITSTIRFDQTDDLFAASDDLLGILGFDVPASTAVTNSARFPYISPAGRFKDQGRLRQVIDGGYFENYGVRTAAELARGIGAVGVRHGLDILPVVVVVSNDADALRETPEEARKLRPQDPDLNETPTLEEVTVTCRSLTGGPAAAVAVEIASEREKAVGGYAAEFIGPLLGLYATRGAHGQDALHILRRQQCPPPGENSLPRLFHVALPRPEQGKEAAPMNWVLNPAARAYLLEVAPMIPFNLEQAKALHTLFTTLRQRGSIDR